MKRFKVLVVQPIHPKGLEVLQNADCDYVIPDKTDAQTLLDAAREVDAILVRTAVVSRELIEGARGLKVIARHGAGFDNIAIQAAAERGIPVCNTPNANSNSVAEHTVGMMVALSHQMLKGDRAIREGQYHVRNLYIGTELQGKTLGLVGLGNIGRRVALKCALGMGMSVVAYDPYIRGGAVPDFVDMRDSLNEVLAEADFVSLHLPYIAELHHIIDEAALAQMKAGAFLMNCARGGLIDEEALYTALKKGRLAGAGLDVFEQEPPSERHPLWELDNVIITPHMSAHTDDAMIAMAVGAAEEIVRVLKQEKPLYCVNKHLISHL